MENSRSVKFLFVVAGIILWIPYFIFAYDDKTTHPALTQEIVKFFNRSFPEKALGDSEMTIIMRGSIDEDTDPRWLHHFYDPVYNMGLVWGDNEIFRERELAAIIGGTRSEWTSSKEWARDTRQQAGLIAGIFGPFLSGRDDYSWDRAIYEYAWGDKNRGLLALGHILHLIEDATVPDHTRNDPHIPGYDASPYEFWTSKFTPNNMQLIDGSGQDMKLLSDLDSYFDALANYSNRNFFSKDTIFSKEYIEPKVTSYEGEFGFYSDRDITYPIVRQIKKFDGTIEYTLIDNKRIVLDAYWSLLSKQAVLNGAGVVKLFFDEMEKEKQTKALYNKNRSWVVRVLDKTRESFFNLAGVLYGITAPYDLESEETAGAVNMLPPPAEATPTAEPAPSASGPLPSAETSAAPQSEVVMPQSPEKVEAASSTVSSATGSSSDSQSQLADGEATSSQTSFSAEQSTTTAPTPPAPEPEVFVSSPVYRRGPEQTTTYTPSAMDVIINEIAWAGTAASTTADEWIELYNRTSQSISLDGWILRSATDEKPYLNLTGTIAAGGYYLIERTDDNTVSNIAADFIAPFGSGTGLGLVDAGEMLSLQYASTTIDQTPVINACGANQWCGGNTSERKTMERIDPDLTGTDTASWGTNDGLIKNGSSTDAIALNATPKSRNSRNYYISQTGTVSSNQTLTSSKSPYFIDSNGLTISSGVTLTINSGVAIKLYGNNTDITVNGTLKALGSSGSEVVFTSFYDDNYGGDMNGDGSATSPSAGDWRHIVFNSASQNSEFSYARVRYGGRWYAGQTTGHALIKADNSSVTVSNSVLEKSMQYGLWLINSTSTISNSTIQNNAVDSIAYGIFMDGGASTIQSNTLTSNTIGIRVEGGGSPSISGNTITSSTNEAISVVGSTPTLSSNSASSNGVNSVLITGTMPANYTFSSNLPYVVDSTLTLISGKTFGTTAGTVFKGKTSSATIEVQGTFNISGSSGSPVVFTSLKDDNYGGDTNADGSATSASAGDWRAINFASTATSSSVSYALVRYGGDSTLGAMSLDSVGVDVSNSTFEFNKYKGLRLTNATSTLSNLTVRNHTSGGGEPAGIFIEGGSRAVINNSAFNSNTYGVMSTGGSTVSNGGGNTFSGNTNNTFPAGLLE